MSHLWEGEWHQDEDTSHIGVLNLKTKIAVLGVTLPAIEINAKAEQVNKSLNPTTKLFNIYRTLHSQETSPSVVKRVDPFLIIEAGGQFIYFLYFV